MGACPGSGPPEGKEKGKKTPAACAAEGRRFYKKGAAGGQPLSNRGLVIVQLSDAVNPQGEVGGGAQDRLLESTIHNGLAGVIDKVTIGVKAKGRDHMTIFIGESKTLTYLML